MSEAPTNGRVVKAVGDFIAERGFAALVAVVLIIEAHLFAKDLLTNQVKVLQNQQKILDRLDDTIRTCGK